MKDTIVIDFSNGFYRVSAWVDQSFCLIPDRKGNTETPDVFYVDEINGPSVGYPADTYDVRSGRYLDGILDHITEPSTITGFSGLDCMTMTIRQIQRDVKSFLGFSAQTMIFLVPYTFSTLQHKLVKRACEANGVRGRAMLRVYGVILEAVYQDGCKSQPMDQFSVIGVYLEGSTLEIAAAEIDRDFGGTIDAVIEIFDVSCLQIPFVPPSREERIQALEKLVLEKIEQRYPNLLMMDRTHVIQRVIESAIDEERDGTLSIPYAAIYPNWINADQISVTRRMFHSIKTDIREHFTALTEHRNWRYIVDPIIHALALDQRFTKDPIIKNALLSQWKDENVTTPPIVDGNGLYALHGATVYAYMINNPDVPIEMNLLLLGAHWKEYGILYHGEFVPMMYSGNTDPSMCDIILRLKPAHENQTEIRVPLAEQFCGKVSVFGHIVVDCHKHSDILLHLCTGVDSFVECYIDKRKNSQVIIYHDSDEDFDLTSDMYAFEITDRVKRNQVDK